MNNPIVAGLTRLAQFEGRDSSGRFWPYASLILALSFLALKLGGPLLTSFGIEQGGGWAGRARR